METILIIDDEKSLLDLLTVVFKKEGYAVKSSLSAAGGFEILAKEEIDLVVTDIKMPGADGMDILRYARENLPDLPVILITAFGDERICEEAFTRGTYDILLKPFDLDDLLEVLRHAREYTRGRAPRGPRSALAPERS